MENNFPPILSADEARTEERRPAVSFLRSKRTRNREGGGMRSVISIGASSSESSAWYLRAYRRVFRGWYRGRGLGGRGCARERASSSPPRSLHRNYSTAYWSNDSQAHGSQNPSLKQPSLSTPLRTPFRFEEEKKPRRRATPTEQGLLYTGNNNRRWRRRVRARVDGKEIRKVCNSRIILSL